MSNSPLLKSLKFWVISFTENNRAQPNWHMNRFRGSVVQRNFQLPVLGWKTEFIILPPKLVPPQDHWWKGSQLSKAEQLTPFWIPSLPLFPTGDLPLPSVMPPEYFPFLTLSTRLCLISGPYHFSPGQPFSSYPCFCLYSSLIYLLNCGPSDFSKRELWSHSFSVSSSAGHFC